MKTIRLLPRPRGLLFFEPTESFVQYCFDSIPSRKVVDVGAGRGFLSATLAKNGFQVLAIDLFLRHDMIWPVHVFDATVLEYPASTVPIIARPCHSDWVDQVVDKALQTVDKVIYVGLEHNYAMDLGEVGLQYKCTYLNFAAGREEERVVEITRKRHRVSKNPTIQAQCTQEQSGHNNC